MGQQFYKGRTNNHLTWVMVDATDFATPESAASAATTIKIYGKLRGAAGVNFVSSGTGSLTNDITHVGASALGLYSIGLAKADLSDASAAWYDQYIIALSCTGCARQVLVVDGGIDASALSALQSRMSDVQSYLVALSGAISDAHSAAILGASNASEAQSIALVIQSRLSDLDSRLASDLSDVISGITALSGAVSDAHSAATLGASRALVIQSRLSDLDSRLASDTSDILSQVLLATSAASDAASAATQANSRILLVQSRLSDLDSRLVSDVSDVLSGVRSLRSAFIGHEGSTASATGNASTLEIDGIDHADQFNGYWVKLLGGSQVDELRLIVDTDLTNSKIVVKPAFLSAVASGVDFVIVAGSPMASQFHSDLMSRVSDVGSDLRSYLVGLSAIISDAHSAAILGASHASDAHSAATLAASRALLNQSRISDVQSYLVALSDQLSDAHSDLKSALGDVSVTISASDISDIASAVVAALPITSAVSDIYSLLSDLNSNFHSRIPKEPAARSQLSDLASDLLSYLVGISGAVSDAHSAANVGNSRALLVQSRLSDLDSRLVSDLSDVLSQVLLATSAASDAASAAQQANSRVLLVQSRLSDLDSRLVSDLSDVLSQLTVVQSMASDAHSAAAAANTNAAAAASRALLNQSRISDVYSLLSDVGSDLLSYLVGVSGMLSDTHSAATAGASRALLNQSRISDVYSLLSDLHSDLGVVSGVVSDVYSNLAAGVAIGASDMSDLRSAITANGVLRAGADPTTVVGVTDTLAAKVDWMAALARNKITQTATLQSLRNDADNDTVASATVSDDGTTFTRNEWS